MFNQALPDAGEGDFTDYINPESFKVLDGCKAEASLADVEPSDRYQFERRLLLSR